MNITGKDLIELGYRQGKWFSAALDHANANQLTGDALVTYLDGVVPQYIDPHTEPKPYHVNIEAANELEQDNVDKVCESMDVLMRTPTLTQGAIMPDACPTGPAGHIPVGGIAIAHNAIPSYYTLRTRW